MEHVENVRQGVPLVTTKTGRSALSAPPAPLYNDSESTPDEVAMTKLLLMVPVLVGILLAGCAGEEEVAGTTAPATGVVTTSNAPTITATPHMSGTPVATATPSPTPGGTLTYTDAVYGYSFDYPASWYLSPPDDKSGSPILYSYSLASIPSEQAGMPVPKDRLKATFWVAEGVDQPLDQWLAEGRAQASAQQGLPAPTVISQSQAVLDGRQGLTEITQSDSVTTLSYYISLGGERVFVVNAQPSDSDVLAEFQVVIASIRFGA